MKRQHHAERGGNPPAKITQGLTRKVIRRPNDAKAIFASNEKDDHSGAVGDWGSISLKDKYTSRSPGPEGL